MHLMLLQTTVCFGIPSMQLTAVALGKTGVDLVTQHGFSGSSYELGTNIVAYMQGLRGCVACRLQILKEHA